MVTVRGQETADDAGTLPVTEADVIRFLRTRRDNGTPAWQRVPAVRAVELYRNLVLKTQQPALHEIRQTLGRLADRERAGGPDGSSRSAHLSSRAEEQLIGRIDPHEPAITQQMRRELRLRRKALESEKAYVGWVRRFIGYCGSEDLPQFGEPQIRSFLTRILRVLGLIHFRVRDCHGEAIDHDEAVAIVARRRTAANVRVPLHAAPSSATITGSAVGV